MKQKRRTKHMDMLHGPIWSKLPQYALPVAATGILEQLFNASDLAIVGNFTGANKTIAVAAVGANTSVIGLILNLFIGIALGVNVVIANAIGKKDDQKSRAYSDHDVTDRWIDRTGGWADRCSGVVTDIECSR